MRSARDREIDAIRGLAAILLVAHHAALILRENWIPATPLESVIYNLAGLQSGVLQPFRMPLFAIISGWLYALRPVSVGGLIQFSLGKSRRLFFPMAFAATIFFVINSAADSSTKLGAYHSIGPWELASIWKIWLYRNGHFWFIHVMLTCFFVIAVIDANGFLQTGRRWLALLLISAAGPFFLKIPGPFFSAGKFLDLWIFFLFGVGVQRFFPPSVPPRKMIVWWLALLGGFAAHVAWKLGGENFNPWPHFVVAGCAFAVCVRALRISPVPLPWIGSYSLSIYLFHPLWIGLLLKIYFIPDLAIARLLALPTFIFAGLAVPIATHELARRSRFLSAFALGLKPDNQSFNGLK